MKPALLDALSECTRRSLAADALAGVTVAMVAIPLSLAIAIASGAPPAAGLTTAVVAGFLISALGGSRVQIGGPTGAFIVVVFDVIATHGHDGLIVATLMAGLILIAAGLLRVGSLIAHVPEPVINGFTVGIAVIIAASQLGDLLGVTTATPADVVGRIGALWAARAAVSPAALGVGLGAIALIVALRRLAPRWPGLIVAVAAASALGALLPAPVDDIAGRFGPLPAAPPLPGIPSVSADRIVTLLPAACVIAFLAGVESLLSAMVADRMIGARHRPNAEMLAQGAANLGSALFGGLPATGAIARTATNVRAGGRSPVAGMVHAVVILLAMLLAAPLAGRLAMPALAGLLIVTAWNMSEPHRWRSHFRGRVSDSVLFLLTLALTVLTDLTVAIAVGVGLGLALRLRRRAPPADWTAPDR